MTNENDDGANLKLLAEFERTTRINVLAAVLTERARQVCAKGYTPEHDDTHDRGELAAAACYYAFPFQSAGERLHLGPELWPFDDGAPELPYIDDANEVAEIMRLRKRRLVQATALLVAELERLERLGAGAKVP